MKKKSILFALAAVCLPVVLSAQQERKITLNEAIAMARVQSVDAAVALNELKTAYWEYRTFRADLLPEVNLTGTLPNYNKSYGSYQNADGSYSFVLTVLWDFPATFPLTRTSGLPAVNFHWCLRSTI